MENDQSTPQEPRRDTLGRKIGKMSRKGAERHKKNSVAHGRITASIRWDTPLTSAELASLESGDTPASAVARILANRDVYLKRAQSVCLRVLPDAMANMGKMARGLNKRATGADQVAATKLIKDTAAELAESLGMGNRLNLGELGLDQLESLLSGALSGVRDAQAIESQGFRVPSQGTRQVVDADPAQPVDASQAPSSGRPLTPGEGAEGSGG